MSAIDLPFRPLPFIAGPHAQTILGSLLPARGAPPSRTRHVTLDDGDTLALEVSTPPDWLPEQRTVLMIHGLCGCHLSSYLVRMARALYRRGIRAVRMNLRGCGSGRGLARRLYHSGRSEDAFAALRSLHDDAPGPPIALVGFSLGGNIALKLAGELGPDARELISQVVAVCPPADLRACSERLSRPQNRLYDRHFVKLLLADIADRHRRFPELGPYELPRRPTLFEFDDLYTAPRSGFADALDYYSRCSSAPLAPRIAVPCKVLLASDDPVVDPDVLDGVALPSNVEVVKTARGGHLGFLGIPGRGGWRWMDARLMEWLT